MKKRVVWAAMLLLAALLMCGCAYAQDSGVSVELKGYTPGGEFEYVQLGYFPFTSGGGEQPVLWRVLSVEDDIALLRSEYAIDVYEGDKHTHEDQVLDNVTCKILGTYMELSSITTGSIPSEFDLNSDFYGYSTDSVSDRRKVKATPYAASRGVLMEKGYAGYWSYKGGRITSVSPNGGFVSIKRPMALGVVPMITASVSELRLNRGSGTMADPYRSTYSARDIWFERNMRISFIEHLRDRHNPYRKKIPVYTGPGEDYYQPEDNVLHKQSGGLNVLGREGSWLLIEYHVGDNRYRTGYVYDKLVIEEGDDWWHYWSALPNKAIPALTTQEAMLYEDRNLMGQPLYVFEMGRDVTLLGYLQHKGVMLAYVEAEIYDQKARGFMRLECIEPEGYDIGFMTVK